MKCLFFAESSRKLALFVMIKESVYKRDVASLGLLNHGKSQNGDFYLFIFLKNNIEVTFT